MDLAKLGGDWNTEEPFIRAGNFCRVITAGLCTRIPVLFLFSSGGMSIHFAVLTFRGAAKYLYLVRVSRLSWDSG